MSNQVVFISHAHWDADLATSLKELIEDSFGAIIAFTSSDSTSVALGQKWLPAIEEAISKADVFIVVLSPASIQRPWVNFEAGAAFGRSKQLIPVCVRGLKTRDVGPPLSSYQLVVIEQESDLELVLSRISNIMNHRMKIQPSLLAKTLDLASPRDDLPPLSPEAERNEPQFVNEMQAELNGLTEARMILWETLDKVYPAISAGVAGYPSTLEALVDSADPPDGIPVPTGEHILDFKNNGDRLLQGAAALLWDFCQKIYPAKAAGASLSDLSLIDSAEFKPFHLARSQHTKAWDLFASRIYYTKTVSIETCKRRFDAQRRLVNLLTYLELALTQSTQDPGEGSRYLFRLNRDWDRNP